MVKRDTCARDGGGGGAEDVRGEGGVVVVVVDDCGLWTVDDYGAGRMVWLWVVRLAWPLTGAGRGKRLPPQKARQTLADSRLDHSLRCSATMASALTKLPLGVLRLLHAHHVVRSSSSLVCKHVPHKPQRRRMEAPSCSRCTTYQGASTSAP